LVLGRTNNSQTTNAQVAAVESTGGNLCATANENEKKVQDRACTASPVRPARWATRHVMAHGLAHVVSPSAIRLVFPPLSLSSPLLLYYWFLLSASSLFFFFY